VATGQGRETVWGRKKVELIDTQVEREEKLMEERKDMEPTQQKRRQKINGGSMGPVPLIQRIFNSKRETEELTRAKTRARGGKKAG